MTYAEAIEFLFGLRLHGQKLGLDTMRALVQRLGNPDQRLRFIHIAGTNGKGSVAAMCHAVLAHAGYRCGLYTSPHLVSFCERFQINQQPIAEADVARLVADIRPHLAAVAQMPGLRSPTFFEAATAMALQYFSEQQTDVVVWETGMGGRLDATNVVTPLVSVVTSVALDHQQYLGDSLAAIAREKAGIIKPRVPVVSGVRAEEARAVIRQICGEQDAPLIEVSAPLDWPTPLRGPHQRWNCAIAVAALRASGLPLSDEQIRDGLKTTRWPGRFQIVPGVPPVILDGAHNPDAARQLAETLQGEFPDRPVSLILGVLRDKDYRAICAILAPLAERIYCVPVNSERTSEPAELAAVCRQANPAAVVQEHRTLAAAYEAARREAADVILITGSLFLVGEAMAYLGLPGTASPRLDRELRLQ